MRSVRSARNVHPFSSKLNGLASVVGVAAITLARPGIDCEGYEVRLRWGSGIASRGRLTGADKPLYECAPPTLKGRWRDFSKEREKLNMQPQIETSRSMNSSTIWQELSRLTEKEVLRDGINALHSSTARDSLLQLRPTELCQESSALYTICLAFQLSLSTTHSARFLEYFDTALRGFRSELARSTTLSDGTLTAGLLLCSIDLMHGLPWTMHLEGMHNILKSHGLDAPHIPATPPPTLFRTHLLEVMGVMDLPHLVSASGVAIVNPRLRGRASRPVSGLPRSLLDLFAGIGLETTEQSLWDWPGEEGSFLQCYLWAAHRLAGILTLRRHIRTDRETRLLSQRGQKPGPGACLADATILVTRILANLDALRLACVERPTEDPFIKNAVLFPFFAAGLEVLWQQTIMNCALGSRQDEILLDLLKTTWEQNDPDLSVDELAHSKGIEMGLL
ncbi:uncharacterized protein N7459_005840 [Penicillium hispanicum]|uniref:uncharacterized protein n=1 Tax=Penicillium hispanicum TaxID=1080232 RepID=UPI002541D2AC|nr:uncharacterized protein N7459_005840 [Penicillium hispanicum]KAJ5579855.1 hypothetical protein N7459_005840 [Penicillium hispanicum]